MTKRNIRGIVRSKNFAFFIVVMGSFMSALDASVVNIALPSMSKYFGAGLTHIQWVITIYGLGIVSLLPAVSKLGNRLGQNRVYALGYVLFGAGSLFCALSQTLECVIVSRFVQAIGAAMMFALAQGVIASIFTGVKRGQSLGMIGSCVALGSITGPSLGGILLDTLGWQSIFYINLPIAVLGAAGSYYSLPKIRRKKLGKINLTALLFFIIASVSFITGISLAENAGWASPHILALLGAAVLFGALLYNYEKTSKSPLINLNLYATNKVFAYGNAAMMLVFIAGSINAILIPFYLQDIYGLSAFKTGMLILFFSVSLVITAPLSGRLSAKTNSSRAFTVGGLTLTIIGMLWYMTLGPEYHQYKIVLGQLILGIGNGMFQSPNNNTVMSSVPRKLYNDVSGLNALSRNIGISAGVCLTVNIFTSLQKYFEHGGAVHAVAFSSAYHLTLVFGIITALCAMVLSYLGKEPKLIKNYADLKS